MFFYNPWAMPCSYYYGRRASNGTNGINGMNGMNSTVRLLHAVPGAPAVDVYADDNVLIRNLQYKQLTPFLTVPAGRYTIKVFPANQTANPLIESVVVIPPAVSATIAAVGRPDDLGLFVIPQPMFGMMQGVSSMPGDPYVRFVHLSPNAPAVDVALQNGANIFSNVEYQDITNYTPTQLGSYTFQVKPAGSNQVVLTVPNVTVEPNSVYTIYAVGLVGEEPSLEALVVTEGRY